MTEQNIAIRLKGFLESIGMTNSQFADTCGIPRPSLSQIISGRNKKVSDIIIGQIHHAFPDLSVLWLLFGEGPMLVGDRQTNPNGQDTPGADAGEVKAGDENKTPRHPGASSPVPNEDSMQTANETEDEASYGRSTSCYASSTPPGGFENANYTATSPSENKYANVRGLASALQTLQVSEAKRVELEKEVASLQGKIRELEKNPRRVTQITIYYDDSTFETFIKADS